MSQIIFRKFSNYTNVFSSNCKISWVWSNKPREFRWISKTFGWHSYIGGVTMSTAFMGKTWSKNINSNWSYNWKTNNKL